MKDVRIHLLGALRVSGDSIDSPRISNAVRRLVALVAASGNDGISRDDLARELWGDPTPESWKSALRNRVTAARKAIGAETLLNQQGRFLFADFVAIDSWDLIDRAAMDPAGNAPLLTFLDGEVLAGIESSPLILRHRAQVADARAVLIQQLVAHSPAPLSPLELQALRAYRRLHPLEPIVTQHVILAHARAGESAYVTKIIDDTVTAANEQNAALPWVAELDTLQSGHTRRRGDAQDNAKKASREDQEENRAATARAELFENAVDSGEWGVAFEIAMEGLPEAARIEGDPERLLLLEALPLERLSPARQFTLCAMMARHLMAVGRESEACDWASLAQSLAVTAEDKLSAAITAALVGGSKDEGEPIPLPPAFYAMDREAVDMQSLQVVVTSHLERSAAPDSAPLLTRFNELVEASADPYRRWHMLLLQSMSRFVAGEIDEAAELASRAHQYANVFNIADADAALLGQLSNARWIHDDFAGPAELARIQPPVATDMLSTALQALATYSVDSGQAANDYMRSFDFTSRSFF